MTPKVDDAHLEARRRQILDAAVVCFSRAGFHASTMQDICRESGLSPGAVYRYFDGKDDIIRAVCSDEVDSDLARLTAAPDAPPRATLRELVDKEFPTLMGPEAVDHLRFKVDHWAESLRNPDVRELTLSMCISYRQAIADLVARAQAGGEADPGLVPEAAARALMALWFGSVVQRALEPDAGWDGYVEAVQAVVAGSLWTNATRGADDA